MFLTNGKRLARILIRIFVRRYVEFWGNAFSVSIFCMIVLYILRINRALVRILSPLGPLRVHRDFVSLLSVSLSPKQSNLVYMTRVYTTQPQKNAGSHSHYARLRKVTIYIATPRATKQKGKRVYITSLNMSFSRLRHPRTPINHSPTIFRNTCFIHRTHCIQNVAFCHVFLNISIYVPINMERVMKIKIWIEENIIFIIDRYIFANIYRSWLDFIKACP